MEQTMNTETITLIIVIVSIILWRLGGMGICPFKKGWRRYILPLWFFLCGILLKAPLLPLLGAVVLSAASYTLPYGKDTPYWLKLAYAFLWTAPTLLLGLSLWQIIIPVVFVAIFWLSNQKWTQNAFSWVICEIITGTGIGVLWAQLLTIR